MYLFLLVCLFLFEAGLVMHHAIQRAMLISKLYVFYASLFWGSSFTLGNTFHTVQNCIAVIYLLLHIGGEMLHARPQHPTAAVTDTICRTHQLG